ncbi:uncharacterized protein LOC133634941 isoform X2 [Entelurus aequoreus]|uniref:uncharacterized protein LOC133634941 isoform X2 n=1 Tax=Entelurus aequoreus TaxID=161455 RepID=UPI002B1E6DCF|nr:uncharacterized protein LOC133634941 isoform X2 [Entelurus aequoreus]
MANRMQSSESKENIEMELFSSDRSCMMISTLEREQQYCFYEKNLVPPLVRSCEENPQPMVRIKQDRRQQAKTKANTPARERTKRYPPPAAFTEEMEMEMETLLPPTSSEVKLGELKTPWTHTSSLKKERRAKWKSLTPQKTGLVVKDVLCLSGGYYDDELTRNIAPHGKEQEALSAIGMAARITVDSEWSPKQLESRLVAFFRERVPKQTGRKFSFTYLQCIESCRVLFVPRTPAEGWTGAQVLRISENGALYLLGHHDHPKAASETAAVDKKEICLEESTESPKWRQIEPTT